MAAPTDVAVGIDVAKARLDIAVEPTGTTWTVPRSRGGLRRLQAQLQARRPTRIVLEASGGYERIVVATLRAAAGGPGQSAPDPRLRPPPTRPGQRRRLCPLAAPLAGGCGPRGAPSPALRSRTSKT